MDLEKIENVLFVELNRHFKAYNKIRTKELAKKVALLVLEAEKQSLEVIRKDLDPYFETTTLYRKVDNKLDHDIKELDEEITKLKDG